jgi:predicted house-cleaning noncanonical NTP pyrophosphatase (MazG superfamily)
MDLKLIIALLNGFVMVQAQNNSVTLQAYERNVQAYVAGTPQDVTGVMQVWIDQTLSLVSKSGLIFEIGSGFGRDAKYMQSAGYQVEVSDATQGFVDLLREQGWPVGQFNVLKDQFTKKYDLIFANAVLLHFTPAELVEVLVKISQSLNPKGVLAFSLKLGDGTGWSEHKLNAPRFFCYWQPESITKLLGECGFEVEFLNSDVEQKWLYIIARINRDSNMKFRKFVQNKLWRDKAVTLMEQTGSKVHLKMLDDVEFAEQLRVKFMEEAAEVSAAKNREHLIEELADILEVLSAMGELHNFTLADVQAAQALKKEKRGGFGGRTFVTVAEHLEGSFGEKYCLAEPEKYPEII